jgi:uncharacterized Fe-S center protein
MAEMSKVYMMDMHGGAHRGFTRKLSELFEAAGLDGVVAAKDLVAIKTHFGERGSTAFVPSFMLRQIVSDVKKAGGRPFLTDAGTLYVGSRSNAYEHLITAEMHGFTLSTTGAPVIIADGLTGHDFEEVEVAGKHVDVAKIASAVVHADAFLAVSHFTGHEVTGFGAALKNVGMGLGSRGGKQQMHSGIKPKVSEDQCTGCGKCLRWCPAKAISLADKKAVIDQETCLGCGECTVMCVEGAIAIRWMTDLSVAQEKIAEYACAVLKDKEGKRGFINFLTNMSPACDCWDFSDAPFAPDIGVLASTDIVAIEQASVDLVNRDGQDLIKKLYPTVAWETPIAHAASLGLGSRAYELITI